MQKRLLRIGLTATMAIAATFAALLPATSASATMDSRADSGSSVIVPLSYWYWGWYHNKAECEDVGRELVRKGWATNFTCTYKRGGYELYYIPA